MTDAITHRGPDDAGHWFAGDTGPALGHRRLSIIDLSPQGHQPMASADSRWTIVFNGEIYNYGDLRCALEQEGIRGWRGSSDTEVLLAGVSHWGLAATLERLVGMFAFALWDARDETLHLARDRMGEKPVYYGWVDGALVFASELKALCAFPGWRGEIDRDVLSLYMRHGYVHQPYAIYKGIRKLPPAHVVSVSAADVVAGASTPIPYWSALALADPAMRDGSVSDPESVLAALDAALRVAVAGQMVADVPVGAFLSGGIDSSLIVALMQDQSTRRVRTFTVGFTEKEFDEAGYAHAVAAHLGTEHTEIYVSPREAMDVIPSLSHIFDEPFADPSQVPTILVCKMAREHVTVCLSGDGGDELFGGYRRYDQAVAQWQKLQKIPVPLRELLATAMPPGSVRSGKIAELLRCRDRAEVYRRLVSTCREAPRIVVGTVEPPTVLTDPSSRPDFADYRDEMMWQDLVTYLPGDILAKVDRAAMSVSLETRIPLLDHRVVDLAWRMPATLKWRDGRGKWPLRELAGRYVPKSLLDRPKRGFGMPVGRWLRGELRPWAEALLSESALRDGSMLDARIIRRRWREHLDGKADWSHYLWNVLMFQAWFSGQ